MGAAMAGRSDPLVSLVRLRRLQTGAARRRLAEDSARFLAAEGRAEAACAALLTERNAVAPADFARWIGRGIAERDRAALGATHAAERLAEGQAALAEARVAERCLERLLQDRASAAEARRLRKGQASADDAAARTARAGGGRG